MVSEGRYTRYSCFARERRGVGNLIKEEGLKEPIRPTSSKNDVLLSVKPKYAYHILSGEKKYEFRKVPFKRKVNRVYLYATYPVKGVIGYFIYDGNSQGKPIDIWDEFGAGGCITEKDFFEYFTGRNIAVAIKVGKVVQFNKIREITSFGSTVKPPQSFIYLWGEE